MRRSGWSDLYGWSGSLSGMPALSCLIIPLLPSLSSLTLISPFPTPWGLSLPCVPLLLLFWQSLGAGWPQSSLPLDTSMCSPTNKQHQMTERLDKHHAQPRYVSSKLARRSWEQGPGAKANCQGSRDIGRAQRKKRHRKTGRGKRRGKQRGSSNERERDVNSWTCLPTTDTEQRDFTELFW